MKYLTSDVNELIGDQEIDIIVEVIGKYSPPGIYYSGSGKIKSVVANKDLIAMAKNYLKLYIIKLICF